MKTHNVKKSQVKYLKRHLNISLSLSLCYIWKIYGDLNTCTGLQKVTLSIMKLRTLLPNLGNGVTKCFKGIWKRGWKINYFSSCIYNQDFPVLLLMPCHLWNRNKILTSKVVLTLTKYGYSRWNVTIQRSRKWLSVQLSAYLFELLFKYFSSSGKHEIKNFKYFF